MLFSSPRSRRRSPKLDVAISPRDPLCVGAGGSLDVLIVEDEETLRESLVEGLASAFSNLSIRGAGSVEDAEALLSIEMPRLVVSDVRLSGRDGVQLLLSVRARSPKTPFVFMSAYPSPEAQEQARNRGLKFLSKPFEFEELMDAVEAALDENQFSGELGGISLVDLLQVLNMGRRTAAVTLERRGEVGRIYLKRGEVVHAQVGELSGRDAFDRLFAWKGGSFGSEPGHEPPETTIAEPFNGLLLDSFRLMDESDDLEGDIDQAFGGQFFNHDDADAATDSIAGDLEPESDPHGAALHMVPGCVFSARVDLHAPAFLAFAPEGALAPPMLELLPIGANRLLGEGALGSLDAKLIELEPGGGGRPVGRIDEAIVLSSDLIYVFQRVPGDRGYAYISVCHASAGLGTVVAKARMWKRSSGRGGEGV